MHIYKTPPPHRQLIALFMAIVFIVVCIVCQSCSGVKKNSTTSTTSNDSSIVVKYDSSGIKSVDSISEKSNTTTNDKSTSDNSESDFDIDFYPPNYDTNNINKPNTYLYIKDSGGGKVVNSNQSLKSFKQKSKKQTVKNDVQTVVNNEANKFNYAETYNKYFELELKKRTQTTITTSSKLKFNFNWLWLLLLLMIPAYKWVKKNYTINI
jgi:hypothetical protein